MPDPGPAIHPPCRQPRLAPHCASTGRSFFEGAGAACGARRWRLRGMESRDDRGGSGGAVAAAVAAALIAVASGRARFLFCVRKGKGDVFQSAIGVTVVISAAKDAASPASRPRPTWPRPGRASESSAPIIPCDGCGERERERNDVATAFWLIPSSHPGLLGRGRALIKTAGLRPPNPTFVLFHSVVRLMLPRLPQPLTVSLSIRALSQDRSPKIRNAFFANEEERLRRVD